MALSGSLHEEKLGSNSPTPLVGEKKEFRVENFTLKCARKTRRHINQIFGKLRTLTLIVLISLTHLAYIWIERDGRGREEKVPNIP